MVAVGLPLCNYICLLLYEVLLDTFQASTTIKSNRGHFLISLCLFRLYIITCLNVNYMCCVFTKDQENQ